MIKLLIAEGQSILREGLRLAANEQPDFKVVGVAEDGLTAISMFEQFVPDATIVDLQLPKALQAIATIHKLSPATTIVALALYAEDARVTSALTLGATFQVLKTATSLDILAAVRDTVIARKAPRG